MKFSYNLIKKLAPGKYDKKILIEKLNFYSFESADLGGDILEISIPANRYSDAASHIGVAREAAAIFGCRLKNPLNDKLKFDFKDKGLFTVNNKEKQLCPRYVACYATNIKVGPSPKWLKNILETCGLRSINNVVDIMNYVMLEVGQPLHAFDADKVKGGIIIRRAFKNEKIKTIDESQYILDKNNLVIADDEEVLAIAGIKGGKLSEVTLSTNRLLVEAANFDGVSIYNSSRKLNLKTDASVRFAHNLSLELAELGMKRALFLLRELTGAKIYQIEDIYVRKQSKKLIKPDLKKMEKLIGIKLKSSEIAAILKKLGFTAQKKFWLVPPLRADINNLEDLTEEIVRFKDYNKLPYIPPHVSLGIAREENLFTLKDKIRKFLASAGFSEVYNYSFVSKEEINLMPTEVFGERKTITILNPLSSNFAYLRDSLVPLLIKNIKNNLRFYEEVRVFEIGKIFGNPATPPDAFKETSSLGIGIVSKNSIFELKGIIDALFGQLGLTDYFMPPFNLKSSLLKTDQTLRIEIGNHEVVGYFGSVNGLSRGAVLELNLEKLLNMVTEEKEYTFPSKYPSVVRDLSLLVSNEVRVGEILNLIQDISPKFIQDVDLIDFYEDERFGEDKKSLTFRIVFQADDKTLTDEEVDGEMAVINQVIEEKFNAELR